MPPSLAPPWSPDVYLEASTFAARAHGDQKVPGNGFPYLQHVTTVAAEVMAALTMEAVGQPDLAVVCALLHDTMEDCGVTAAELTKSFGAAVAAGVAALSKDPSLPKPEAMRDSLRRIQEQPHEVWMVKLADRITNLQPPPHFWKPQKIRTYRAEAIVIVDTLGAASGYLSVRLRAKIEAYPDPA